MTRLTFFSQASILGGLCRSFGIGSTGFIREPLQTAEVNADGEIDETCSAKGSSMMQTMRQEGLVRSGALVEDNFVGFNIDGVADIGTSACISGKEVYIVPSPGTKDFMDLNEVEVISGGKKVPLTAATSSTKSKKMTAAKCVDGNVKTTCRTGRSDRGKWWASFALSSVQCVDQIKITNRPGNRGKRIVGSKVSVRNAAGSDVWSTTIGEILPTYTLSPGDPAGGASGKAAPRPTPPAPMPGPALPAEEPALRRGRSIEAAAFLTKASFGPSLKEVLELEKRGGRFALEWIKDQLQLKPSLHRAYYRSMTNPRFNTALTPKFENKQGIFPGGAVQHGYMPRPACDIGARYLRHVFSSGDEVFPSRNIVVQGGGIAIAGEWRSDVDPALKGGRCSDEPPSDWARRNRKCDYNSRSLRRGCESDAWKAAKHCRSSCFKLGLPYEGDECSDGWARFTGTFRLCSIRLDLQIVGLGSDKDCKSIRYMRNPVMYANSVRKLTAVAASKLQTDAFSADVKFLRASIGSNCDISSTAIRVGSEVWRHEARIMLVENTIETPAKLMKRADEITLNLVESACVARNFLNSETCVVQDSTVCPLACGSAGEVDNDPYLGHLFPMVTAFRIPYQPDMALDRKTSRKFATKQSIWGMQALYAKDQLRQRVASALAQIIVVATSVSIDANEVHMGFYDIFVRNALTNYGDVLREVTSSPVMGMWLTYMGSRSFDASGSYPDENFAREIMQLFTIGLFKLHQNGSQVFDDVGNELATYDNSHVVNFARVFTGFSMQPWRPNYEKQTTWYNNQMDPMKMTGSQHDPYPKKDLGVGFLGDGFPMCTDLSKGSFLQSGARFEFLGYSFDKKFLELKSGSALFAALEQFQATVTLDSTLGCKNEECEAWNVVVVKVNTGFYKYQPPACVYPFFYNGQKTVHKPANRSPRSVKLTVHEDGMVSAYSRYPKESSFPVVWKDGSVPEAGEYDVILKPRMALHEAPTTPEQVLANAKIGHWDRIGKQCIAGCRTKVKTWSSNRKLDESSIFEHNGRFYKNVVHDVQVGSVGQSFRNPPVFIQPGTDNGYKEEAARNEVDALLTYLMEHDNTPIFFVKKLVAHFVTSNPSPAYIEAIGDAFRSGSYINQIGQGKRGDMAATMAAILLHPESVKQTEARNGALRQPMVKLMHFLRAMEFEDRDGEPITFQDGLANIIGQFPYDSPTVFNFFDALFMPVNIGMKNNIKGAEPEPEPEPESEPESESEVTLAPEFEIYTPPWALNWLNHMYDLIGKGDGFGLKGSFKFSPANAADTADELNLLLAGSRLTEMDSKLALDAYTAEGLQGVQRAVVLMPEFHNLGAPLQEGVRKATVAEGGGKGGKAYKALVMLMFSGGHDSFNMVIPVGCSLYDEYKKMRTGGALNANDVIKISASGQKCKQFGIHPSFAFVAEHYNKDNNVAVVGNVGLLVEPLTRSTMKGKRQCRAVSSHANAMMGAKTMECQTPGAGPRGWGGRISDVMKEKGYKSTSFSVNSMSTWAQGFQTAIEIVDSAKGVVTFQAHPEMETVIENITSQTFNNVYMEKFTQEFRNAIEGSENLDRYLKESVIASGWKPAGRVSQMFYQVARIISTRQKRGAERDFFFMSTGGWDMHQNLIGGLSANYLSIDAALEGFIIEMKAQGVYDSVVIMQMSEFGRTLSFNGAGSDHGWGGNCLLMGGSVRGGVYNKWLDTYNQSSEFDAGRGRVIPQYPWESVTAPIAEWLGVDDPNAVFENLKNFPSSVINKKTALFSKM